MLRMTFAKRIPDAFRLAIVIMLEHHAAAAATKIFTHTTRHIDSVQGYKDLWMWHSLEEIEHKSVSFDIWITTTRRGWRQYFYRTITWLIVSPPFWTGFWVTLVWVLWAGRRPENSLGDYWQLCKGLFGVHGLLSSNAIRWLGYFAPGYHPWQEDNSAELQAAMRELVSRYQG